MKRCKTCLLEKPIECFSPKTARCKPCRSKAEVERQKKDPNRKDYMRSYLKCNEERVAETKRSYNQRNRDKQRQWSANRRHRLNSFPLTARQKEEILYYYSVAKEAEILTGEQYEVDHIIPIRGKTMSGLHVPWNLQVVPKIYNRSKYNKVDKLRAFSIGGRAQREEV